METSEVRRRLPQTSKALFIVAEHPILNICGSPEYPSELP